ncbi:MAG: double-strand break repair protein AddB, partial [Pseudolabrys sp.]|nr:double-strand break repair protein AddB [Pseudolabrys sp.]
LARIGIARSDVKTLGRAVRREAFMSEAMRPAGTTELWPKRLQNKDFQAAIDASVENLTLIEAANAEEEALAVAIALREAALEPGKTAALVTPDRALARRVTAALSRWNIEVDDSGGDRLADTPAGLFARLAVEAAIGGLEPVTLLALLKHPLFRFGAAANVHDRAIAALERAVLRGPRPKPGSAGLAHALATYDETRSELHRNDPRKLVSRDDLAAARALVDRLAQALASLEDLKRGEHVLSDLAARHRHVVMALSDAVFSNADGTRLQTVFDDLLNTQAATQMKVAPRDYPEVFEAIAAAGTVRMREKPDVRIRILGPLEARLQPFDRVVLGGLNEDTWPPDAHSDPWLSRPMRQKLGLNLPELRIGLAAHDFEQALGNHEVVITRAMKVAGSPTVTSRFVQRMAALAGERWNGVIKRGKHYLDLARALDAPEEVKAAPRPAPSPPLDVRPGQLSVTEIENWLRDPYTIYAKHVLRLFPLEPIDTAPGAADRGSIIHDAIGKFTGQFASGLPPDPERELTRLGEQSFKPMQDMPEARAFWWPRFKRIASWFAAWERSRRPTLKALYAEITGKMSVPLGNTRTFVLTARADRIELRQDGTYAILDYKTGQPPTEPQVRTGLAPQLTLETAILNSGGFENVAAGSVTEIKYVRLRGGEPPGEEKPIDFKKNGTPDSQAEYAKKRLAGVAAKFLIEGEPYRSLVHPMWAKHYGDYDHLARVKEWAASGGESEYEGPPS